MSFEKEPKRYLVGDGDGGNVYVYGDSHEDDGTAVVARFQPNHIAPVGVGGECIFPAVYIAVTYATAATINLTPILDGVRLPNASQELVLNAQKKTLDRFEVPFSRAHQDAAGTELSRYAIRGTWFGVEITVQDLFGRTPGSLIVEGIEAEYEVVRESAEGGWRDVAGPLSVVWDEGYVGWESRPPGGQSEASLSLSADGYVQADPAGDTAELFRAIDYDWARFGPLSVVWDEGYGGWESRPPGGQSEASLSLSADGYVQADPAGDTAELFRAIDYDWGRF